jgi:hypothetical protein
LAEASVVADAWRDIGLEVTVERVTK